MHRACPARRHIGAAVVGADLQEDVEEAVYLVAARGHLDARLAQRSLGRAFADHHAARQGPATDVQLRHLGPEEGVAGVETEVSDPNRDRDVADHARLPASAAIERNVQFHLASKRLGQAAAERGRRHYARAEAAMGDVADDDAAGECDARRRRRQGTCRWLAAGGPTGRSVCAVAAAR